MKNHKLLKAFTLIELMVVIAIIGILAAIVFAPLQTALRKGRDAKKISEMKTLQTALMLYADSHNGEYPESLIELRDESFDSIPTNSNFDPDGKYLPNMYNYTGYYDEVGQVKGYHLYVHLETANQVIASAAKCYSVTTTYATTSCFVSSNTNTSGIDEPGEGFDPGRADFTDHSKDSDKECAGNTALCMYDIKG